MENLTVLVLADQAEPRLSILNELPSGARVVLGNTAERFAEAGGSADVLFDWAMDAKLSKEVFRLCPKLRWMHVRAAGLDGWLFPELVQSPVTLTNGTGVFSQSLGEWVIGAVLYFAKDFRRLMRSQAAGKWDQFDVVEIAGQTIGIVGYGDIGRAVGSRAKAMGMKVVGLKRGGGQADDIVSRIYGPEGLREMLAECDYVVIATPLTEQTRGMIGAAELAAMKPEAVLINVGRGAVVDEAALIAALEKRAIKGAALDVFAKEPLPDGHRFYKMENVLLSPHSADHTADWLDQAMRFFVQQFQRFQAGEPLLNQVRKTHGY
jgi:phosphoglycerate dehydrogenase-like enzyme